MATPTTNANVLDRLWSKIRVRSADECWPFVAAKTRGGRREVEYGSIQIATRHWRVNRLVLILHTAPEDCPREADEGIIEWLIRAARCYSHLDAAHSCDNGICCNPYHLKWEDHLDNVRNQFRRRRVEATDALGTQAATPADRRPSTTAA